MARVALRTLIACAMLSTGCSRPSSTPVTFNKHVAPIVFANCATCHRPGGDAPFSLLTYADAADRATEIGEQTLARHMPPWLPEPGDVPIVGVRKLSADQIDTIQRWVKSGALEGKAADLPAPPAVSSSSVDWQLGAPDAVLTMPRPFVLSPGQEDVYRNVILHGNVPDDVFIRAVELRTNGAPIHHALIRFARGPVPQSRDGEGGQPGFSGMSSDILEDPAGQFLGWAPGRGPMVSPDGMPWRFERGTDLALELHLIPSHHPANIQPSIGLYFSSAPPAHQPVTAMMVSKLIDIPAGDANHAVTDRYELPVAADLVGLFPHAHYLGKEMLVTATHPTFGSSPKTLLHIKHWSFHWQQDYRYVTPVSLPKGTVIDLRFTYDNSASNPENPNNPPVRVRLGPRSTDEMANLGLQFLTASPADTNTLLASFFERNVLANIAYAEARVREAPDSVNDRVLLGSSYVQAGRFSDALPHLDAALKLDPRNAIAESQLGGAYQGLGQMPQALEHFRRSASLAPKDERAQINLAGALLSAGRVSEALPDSADAHCDLGAVLAEAGFKDEAARELQRALELDPNHATARQNLALLIRGGGD